MKRAALCVVLVLSGCASGYQQFYHPLPGAHPAPVEATTIGPSPGTPLVDHIRTYTPETLSMYEAKGYAPIGYSAFTAPSQQSESGAITQGKNVGADLVVVVSPEYVASKPVVAPVVSPGGSDSAMTGHADVPVTIKWFKYGALYFVKDESGKGTPPA